MSESTVNADLSEVIKMLFDQALVPATLKYMK